MAIIETVTLSAFRDAFVRMGRKNQFSYEGLEILFDYLESLSDDMGENIELDVIALCCEYAEDDYKEIAENYGIDLSNADGDESEELEIVRDYLEYETIICGVTNDGNIVYQQF